MNCHHDIWEQFGKPLILLLLLLLLIRSVVWDFHFGYWRPFESIDLPGFWLAECAAGRRSLNL